MDSTLTGSEATSPKDTTQSKRLGAGIIAATVAGNALEFYDFLTYSTFSVYIGQTFFPSKDPFLNLLLSLATFGVGFFTRPLGGIVIGAYADRAGRKPAMMLTIALITLGTMGLALTPGYASIGLAAPIILVASRLLQGFALGGEVGPTTAVLLESAPRERRGAIVGWQIASQGIAIFVGGAVGGILAAVLDTEQLARFGWRLAFLLGLAIVPLGIYLRSRLPETLERPGSHGGMAVLGEVLRRHSRQVGLGILVIMCLTITTYIGNYMTTYALTTLKMPPAEAMLATLTQGLCTFAAALLGGRLSDRYGRKIVMIVPRAILMLAIYPAFVLLVSTRTAAALVGLAAFNALLSGFSGGASITALSEIFPNRVRSSGIAIMYAFAVSVFGGSTQFVIAWLTGTTGDPLSPALYAILTS
ncbi:MAG: MFS transporter, partial [Burkholderiaceae bacterium]|nr:MFS transporter [Burkholderiaceae bacterium]